jgi:hypothetical protein
VTEYGRTTGSNKRINTLPIDEIQELESWQISRQISRRAVEMPQALDRRCLQHHVFHLRTARADLRTGYIRDAARTKDLILATRDEAIIEYGNAGHVRVLKLLRAGVTARSASPQRGAPTDVWAQPEVIKQIFDFFDAHWKSKASAPHG